MSKVIGICNLHNEAHLGEITKNRPLAVVSFLGRYGIIDFTLSNFSNSHIDQVYILARKGILQIRRHISSGAIYTNNTKLGFVQLLVNEKGLSNKAFNTDIKNIQACLDLDEMDFEYAVIAPSYYLSAMDFRPLVEEHISSGAPVSVVYKHVNNANKEYLGCDRYRFDVNERIVKRTKNLGRSEEADISLETYIVSKKVLKKIVNDSEKVSELFSIRDMVNFFIEENTMEVHGIEFTGYVVPILTLNDYVNHSFELLNYDVRSQLFKEDWPVYTTTHNTPPALYGREADVKNSFIANGAIIRGKVTNSIISREVVVERGAEVKNSIVFTRTMVGKDVKLDHVLCDKSVSIVNSKKLSGEADDVFVISQGAKL